MSVSARNGTFHPSTLSGIYRRFRQLIHELAKFGVVGAIAGVIDIGGSNVLRYGVHFGPLTSKAMAVGAAATFAYLGNRYWTWRHRYRSGFAREYLLFFFFNGVGLLIALVCLWFTVHLLGFDTPLAYNLSGNVVGLGLGTVFRYWSYKKWVFLPDDDEPEARSPGLRRVR